MVTNLPEEARAQWDKVSATTEPEQKLEELKKFYSMVPKHKGTSNLRMQVRKKMASLRKEVKDRESSSKATHVTKWSLPKHGVARVGILGYSHNEVLSVFNALTEKDDWPYGSYEPTYGILQGADVQFQAVALPPLDVSERVDRKTLGFARTCNCLFFVEGRRSQGSWEGFLEDARRNGIEPQVETARVEFERVGSGGIRLIGRVEGATASDVESLLRDYGIYDGIVTAHGEATLDDVESAILGLSSFLPTVRISHEDNWFLHISDEGEKMPLDDSDGIANYLFEHLSLIRVYTRIPGEPTSEEPIVLKKGATVGDLTEDIHSWLAKNFRHAQITREGRESRVRVSKDYPLEDGDIVEIHAR